MRPLLEYGSIIWSPYTLSEINDIEKIQHKFLRFIFFSRGGNLRENNYFVDYNNLMEMLNLETLELRRLKKDLIFLYKVLHGMTNTPELLQLFPLNIPSHLTRHFNLFHTDHHQRHYLYNNPIDRLKRLANNNDIDIFNCKLRDLKKLTNIKKTSLTA